ncbi:MAG: hypothetical protein ACRDQ4_05810 [Pseudonocardiaceae bacterium]
MSYLSSSSVLVSAWVGVDGESAISYQIYPDHDVVEFTLGGRDGLVMQTSEAGLRRCVTEFTSALHELEAAAAAQPDTALPADPACR